MKTVDDTAAAAPAEAEAASGIGPDGRAFVRVTLEDGRKVVLKKPLGGDYRGAPMSECYRMDVVALSKVVSRVSEPTISAAEYLALGGDDCAKLGGEIVAFLMTKAERAEAGLTE